MKKITLVAVVVAAFSLTSCKKDYTCTCTTTGNGTSVSASTTIKDTKKNAESACEAKSTSGAGYTTTCEI